MDARSRSDAESQERPEVRLEKLLERARGLEQAGRAAEAERILDEAPEALRPYGGYCYAKGALAFRRGDVDLAISQFARAIELSPAVAEYYGNLGAALLERGRRPGGRSADLQRAAATLERGAALSPRLAFVQANRGIALQLLARHEEALEAFGEALGLDAEDRAALYGVAASLHALGREVESLAALDRLLAVDASFAPGLRSRAATLARLGRRAEAETALARYLAAAPGAADAAELGALVGGR